MATIDKLKALSVRQPWAELIMRGEKVVEYRSQPTKIRGRVYIYASLTKPDISDREIRQEVGCSWDDLPKGVLVGTVEIADCDGSDGEFEWQLAKRNALRSDSPFRTACR